HPPAVLSQGRAQVDGGGGLTHPTLLVGHGDDAGRAVPVDRPRLRDRLTGGVRRRVGRAKVGPEPESTAWSSPGHRGRTTGRVLGRQRHRRGRRPGADWRHRLVCVGCHASGLLPPETTLLLPDCTPPGALWSAGTRMRGGVNFAQPLDSYQGI